MITKTDFWKSIRRGFKDMKRDQEMTKQVMAIIKAFLSKTISIFG